MKKEKQASEHEEKLKAKLALKIADGTLSPKSDQGLLEEIFNWVAKKVTKKNKAKHKL